VSTFPPPSFYAFSGREKSESFLPPTPFSPATCPFPFPSKARCFLLSTVPSPPAQTAPFFRFISSRPFPFVVVDPLTLRAHRPRPCPFFSFCFFYSYYVFFLSTFLPFPVADSSGMTLLLFQPRLTSFFFLAKPFTRFCFFILMEDSLFNLQTLFRASRLSPLDERFFFSSRPDFFPSEMLNFFTFLLFFEKALFVRLFDSLTSN